MISIDALIEILILIGIIASAIYVAEARPISRAVGGFVLFSVLVAILYLYLNCTYLAGAQIAIYTGAVVGLLLLGMSITRLEVPEEPQYRMSIKGLFSASLVAVITFSFIFFYFNYVPSVPADMLSQLIERTKFGLENLEGILADHLWKYRGLDIMMQAIIVIGVAAGLSHFFKKEKKR